MTYPLGPWPLWQWHDRILVNLSRNRVHQEDFIFLKTMKFHSIKLMTKFVCQFETLFCLSLVTILLLICDAIKTTNPLLYSAAFLNKRWLKQILQIAVFCYEPVTISINYIPITGNKTVIDIRQSTIIYEHPR